MKKDIAAYVSKCLTCSQIKAEQQKPSGLLTIRNARMEMGIDNNGFCYQITQNKKR